MAKTKKSNIDIKNVLKSVDFSVIPDSEEFKKIKVRPKNRWFNSIMAINVVLIGICLGVITICLILLFA